MWAFAREKVKDRSQQDSYLTEGSKASSGIETRRKYKGGGCKEVRRRDSKASRENGHQNRTRPEAKKERKKERRRKEMEKVKRSSRNCKDLQIFWATVWKKTVT